MSRDQATRDAIETLARHVLNEIIHDAMIDFTEFHGDYLDEIGEFDVSEIVVAIRKLLPTKPLAPAYRDAWALLRSRVGPGPGDSGEPYDEPDEGPGEAHFIRPDSGQCECCGSGTCETCKHAEPAAETQRVTLPDTHWTTDAPHGPTLAAVAKALQEQVEYLTNSGEGIVAGCFEDAYRRIAREAGGDGHE